MAPAHTFLFGSLDLSAYLRVQDGDGLDPYDRDGFEDPQFVDSPLADGQTLTNANVDNRQQEWPLWLNTSGTSVQNLLRNPSGEKGTKDWTVNTGTLITDASSNFTSPSGDRAFRVTATVLTNDVSLYSHAIPCTPGQQVYASARYFITGSANNTGAGNGPRLRIEYDTGAGTWANGNSDSASIAPQPASTLSSMSVQSTVPGGSTQMRLRLVQSTSGTQTVDWLLDSILCVFSSSAVSYFDGSSPGAAWDGVPHDSTSTLFGGGKSGLHLLARAINREIRYGDKPLRVAWKDAGGAEYTYFDVAYARFDPDFSMRPGQKNWLAGALRVWTKPYGHTGTYRSLGTGAGTSFFRLALASIVGDVNADVSLDVSHVGNSFQPGAVVGIGVVPLGYQHAFLPGTVAPSHLHTGSSIAGLGLGIPAGTLAAVSGTPGSAAVALRLTIPSNNFAINFSEAAYVFLPSAANFVGRSRVWALAKTNAPSAGWALIGPGGNPVPLNPSSGTLSSAVRYRLYDLGVLTVPTYSPTAGFSIAPQATYSGASTGYVDIGAVYLMPEDSSFYYIDRDFSSVGLPYSASGFFHVDPDGAWLSRTPTSVARTGYEDGGRRIVGPKLTIKPMPSQTLVGFTAPINSSYDDSSTRNLGDGLNYMHAALRVRERFTFAR